MHLPIILIERIHLLQVYFSHFIAKQGTLFKDICFKQVTQFCSACSSSGLIYYGPTKWAFRRQIPYVSYFAIITYYEVFPYYFPNQFFKKKYFFAFWCKKIRWHLVKEWGHHFPEGIFCRGQLSGRQYSLVAIILGGNCSGCNYPRGNYTGGSYWRQFSSGAIVLEPSQSCDQKDFNGSNKFLYLIGPIIEQC